MNISIPLNISEQALQPFRTAWQQASRQQPGDVPGLLERCRQVDLQQVPASLQPHIGKVSAVADLLADHQWMIDEATRRDLTGALAYFDLADDLIPDSDPRFGLLDDAIVIEMALDEHREVWAAWQEYRRFCDRHSDLGTITVRQWRELCEAARQRQESFVELRYARSDQRTRYQMLGALPPRIELH